MLEKLKAVKDVKSVTRLEVGEEESRFLTAAASYATEYCSVEGGIMTEDGWFSTKHEFAALREKLRSLQGKRQGTN